MKIAAPEFKITFTADDWLETEEAITVAAVLSKRHKMEHLEFEDEKGAIWTLKELEQLKVELQEEPDEITVFFDGSYDKESGLAGIGYAIYFKQNGERYRIRKNKSIYVDTNNEAEYASLYEALEELKAIGVSRNSVTIKGDSLVVLNQLKGDWPCYDNVHSSWLDRIESSIESMRISPTFEVIPRKENKEADDLAKKSINQIYIKSRMKLTENIGDG
jgi:ribonuclease HI